MAPLPRFREIRPSKVQQGPEWTDFFRQLNAFVREMYDSLSGNLTPSENLAQCWLEVKVTEGKDTAPVPFVINNGRGAYGVSVEAVTVASGTLTGAVGIEWEQKTVRGSPCIHLTSVYGLGSGAVATLRLLVKAK